MPDIFPSDPEGDVYADAWVRTLTHPDLGEPERVFVYNAYPCRTDRRTGSRYSHHTSSCRLEGPCERHFPHECDPAQCDNYLPDRELVPT